MSLWLSPRPVEKREMQKHTTAACKFIGVQSPTSRLNAVLTVRTCAETHPTSWALQRAVPVEPGKKPRPPVVQAGFSLNPEHTFILLSRDQTTRGFDLQNLPPFGLNSGAGTQTRSRAVVKPAVGAGEACVDEAGRASRSLGGCPGCILDGVPVTFR